MTLKELNFFYKLSDNPQVTQVAQELKISQSAISLAIKSLENKLEEQLFDRVGKKLILNERGRYFKEKTLPHYLAIIDSQKLFQKNKLAGNMKIASSKTISNYLMPDIYYEFLSTYSDVKFDISTINSTKIIENILNSNLDIGLIEIDINNSNLIKQKLCDDELIIAISKNAVKKELESKKLFQIKLKNFEFKREFHIVYHKDKSTNLLFQTFIDFLKSKF